MALTFLAAYRRDIEMTQVPIVEPRFPDQDVRLLEAARRGELSAVNELLEAGAEIDVTDAAGHTPLLFAAMAGRSSVVRRLVEAGADVAHRDALGYDAYTAAMYFGDFKGATLPPFDEIMALVQPRR